MIRRTPQASARRRALAHSAVETLEGRQLLAAFTVDTTVDTVAVNFTTGATADGTISLRSAIQAADATSGPSTITLPAGIYNLSIPIGGNGDAFDDAASGDLDITGNLTLNGAGSAGTIVNANGIDRVLAVASGTSPVVLSGVTLAGGAAGQDSAGPGLGGGILLTSGNLTLGDDTSVTANQALDYGGGLGGGIYEAAGTQLTLTNSTVSNNTAGNLQDFGEQAPSQGGGIYNAGGQLTLTNSTVSGNQVNEYGGATEYGGVATGGGIYNNSPGNLIVQNSTISGNTSTGQGGGIANIGGVLIVGDSTIGGNTATLNGGGILLLPAVPPATSHPTEGGDAVILGATIAGNSSSFGQGGGIYMSDTVVGSIKNTILANNTPGGDYAQAGTGAVNLVSLGHNLVDDDASEAVFNATGDLNDVNAMLGPLQANGGPTLTQAPLAGSPALGAGDPAQAPATDQRGQPRLTNGTITIGAVEGTGTIATPPAIAVAPGITATPSPATVGQDLTYIVTATNNSDAPATGVVLAFSLPAGATFVPGAGSPTPANGVLSFPLGTLAAHASASETVVVSPTAPGTLNVGANVTATNESVVGNPLPFSTVVNAAVTTPQTADLAVVVTPPSGPIVVGVPTTFSVTVTNDGPNPATGVLVTVPVPGGTTVAPAVAGSSANNPLTFPLGTLAVGASATVTIALTPGAPGTITLAATAKADQSDPASANNTATAAVTVIAPVGADGPTVLAVQRFGYHAQPTSLYLTFSTPLATASATNAGNYRAYHTGRHGAKVGRGVAPSSATYDSFAQAVTLHFAHRLNVHRSYILAVHGQAPGGLTDPAGNALGSVGGSAGVDFTAVIDRSSLAGPASALPGGSATSAAKVGLPSAAGVDALFGSEAFSTKRAAASK